MSKFQMRQIMSCDRALALFETIWRCLFPEHSKFRQKESNFNANCNTVKLGNKEQFDKEPIGIKEPFPVTNLPLTS